MRILIGGGTGFIGSHLAEALLRRGHTVRALDNLSPQVHGANAIRPPYLDADVELVRGDVRDADSVRRGLRQIDAVYHFAAAVGVGQSMYEVDHYTSVNNHGTATLLQAVIEQPVQRLIVASSMSLYGEGLYGAPDGSHHAATERPLDQLKAVDREVRNAAGEVLTPIPTPEIEAPSLSSVTCSTAASTPTPRTSSAPRRRRTRTTSSSICRTGTTPSSAPPEDGCQADSGSASAWRAPF
jgi:dTDP-L-rhamnose 4-epimerase